jgi:hypothetical protein
MDFRYLQWIFTAPSVGQQIQRLLVLVLLIVVVFLFIPSSSSSHPPIHSFLTLASSSCSAASASSSVPCAFSSIYPLVTTTQMASEMTVEDFAWAAKTGDLNNVRKAVEQLGFSVNLVEEGANGRTPLHWAADFGQVEVMQYLLSKKANVNNQDRFGITPLLAAVYEGHEEAVKFLVKNKADKTVKGPDGMTAKEAAEKESIRKLL